jgi:hypothetical protein
MATLTVAPASGFETSDALIVIVRSPSGFSVMQRLAYPLPKVSGFLLPSTFQQSSENVVVE